MDKLDIIPIYVVGGSLDNVAWGVILWALISIIDGVHDEAFVDVVWIQ